MSLPNTVTISTSLLTDLGDAVRERFGVSGDLTIPQMAETINPVPSEYQVLDFIGSQGSSSGSVSALAAPFVNTGIYMDSTVRIVSTERLLNTTHNFSLQGVTQADNNYAMISWGTTNGNTDFRCKVGQNNNSWTSTGVARNLNHHTWDLQSGSQKLDGVEYATQTVTTANASAKPILLFARWESATQSNDKNFAYVEIINCKIYQSGVLVRNYIPCKRKSDNVLGLYDTVNNTFKANEGGGSFFY